LVFLASHNRESRAKEHGVEEKIGVGEVKWAGEFREVKGEDRARKWAEDKEQRKREKGTKGGQRTRKGRTILWGWPAQVNQGVKKEKTARGEKLEKRGKKTVVTRKWGSGKGVPQEVKQI